MILKTAFIKLTYIPQVEYFYIIVMGISFYSGVHLCSFLPVTILLADCFSCFCFRWSVYSKRWLL